MGPLGAQCPPQCTPQRVWACGRQNRVPQPPNSPGPPGRGPQLAHVSQLQQDSEDSVGLCWEEQGWHLRQLPPIPRGSHTHPSPGGPGWVLVGKARARTRPSNQQWTWPWVLNSRSLLWFPVPRTPSIQPVVGPGSSSEVQGAATTPTHPGKENVGVGVQLHPGGLLSPALNLPRPERPSALTAPKHPQYTVLGLPHARECGECECECRAFVSQ